MRILYVIRSLAVWGGIERVLVEKINLLVNKYGYEVFVLTSDQGNHPIPYQLDPKVHIKDLGIRFHQQYQYHGLKRLLVEKRLKRLFKRRLSSYLRTIHPDVIVCTSANYVDINILAGLKGNTPLVVEVHSIFRQTIGCPGLRNRYADFMYRRGLKKAACIVVLTKIDAEDWRQIHPHVEVIPNIVHLNNGNISTLDNKRVIWVGRFDYQKRPMEMIDIWKMLHPRFPDWHLDIYGEGELRQELEAAAKIKDMNIHIHQPTEHIFDAYRDSSILVSTSLYEPFGLVIPEAMSCGLPVVAYDCPYGPASFLHDGVFLIPLNNKFTFAERLSELINDSVLRRQMGDRGIVLSKEYDPARIMPIWISLFSKIVSGNEEKLEIFS